MLILRGTFIGGVSYFLIGWLVYGVLLYNFFSPMTNTCANRSEGEMIWWAMILSNLLIALFLTLFLSWSGARSITDGLKTGALFGALFTATIDLSLFSMTTMYKSLLPIVIEIVASAVVLALVGMIIVLTRGKERQGNL
ncbi:MAG: DUF1761 domain-containing protein [Bacteroidales bacterium]|nr:DUF1761 domain-containing protein [Bacteroidales bacterium]